MTTPQDMLHRIKYNTSQIIEKLSAEFDDEGHCIKEDIFAQMDAVSSEMKEITNKMDAFHDILLLIVKLLSKD